MDDYTLHNLGLGETITDSVYNDEGHLLISKGAIISYELLSKLKKHNGNYFRRLDQLSQSLKPDDLVSKEDMKLAVEAVQTVFVDMIHNDKTGLNPAIPNEHIDLVVNVVESLMATLYTSERLLYTVTELMDSDDYTYRHSVNVAILSILTAKSMHYTEKEIKNIALGALLHDIGKAKVVSLVRKPAELTEFEKKEMKMHPEYGYQMVKDIDTLPYSVKQIIRYHHEKMDGSGYPFGLVGMEIPLYIRLITVCDMYDAMTSNRTYRKKMPIHTALEILMKDAVYKIDPEVYRQMTSTICIFPTGQGVLLSDGRIGIVSLYRHQNPTRPNVQIIDFNVKKGSIDVQEVDLTKHFTLFIIDTWNPSDFAKDFRATIDQNAFYQMSAEEKEKYASSIL